MKLLYVSCHNPLEYDELRLLSRLPVQISCLGYYSPLNTRQLTRPYPDTILYNHYQYNLDLANLIVHDQDYLNWPDYIVTTNVSFIINNWSNIRHKKVIWRTIGQSIPELENDLLPYRKDGLLIVRYSPMEKNIPNYLGEDQLIRFGKIMSDFKIWSGDISKILTFQVNLYNRRDACNPNIYRQYIDGLPVNLFGPHNNTEVLSYEEQLLRLSQYRGYFCIGSHPASYTLNFIEALCAGLPIVTIGKKLGNRYDNFELYEVPYLLSKENGICSDDIVELQNFSKELLLNKDLAKEISCRNKKLAVELFGEQNIIEKWRQFFAKF